MNTPLPETLPFGIYTVANDPMADQLVALLNSIHAHNGTALPVLVIPYDKNCSVIRGILNARENVYFYEEPSLIAHWEQFAQAAWETRPDVMKLWHAKYGTPAVYRLGNMRRFVPFDGPCERWLYLDADMLVLDNLSFFRDALDDADVVVYDDQFHAPRHVFAVDAPRYQALAAQNAVWARPFCAGLFASHRGRLPLAMRPAVLEHLRAGDAEILYANAPDQSLLNFAVMRSPLALYNFFHDSPKHAGIRTCATVEGLRQRDGMLFDRDRRVPFLHYIGIPAWAFQRLCRGQDIYFPYRAQFLHYRYLRTPEARPRLRGKRVDVLRRPARVHRFVRRAARKMRRVWETL